VSRGKDGSFQKGWTKAENRAGRNLKSKNIKEDAFRGRGGGWGQLRRHRCPADTQKRIKKQIKRRLNSWMEGKRHILKDRGDCIEPPMGKKALQNESREKDTLYEGWPLRLEHDTGHTRVLQGRDGKRGTYRRGSGF